MQKQLPRNAGGKVHVRVRVRRLVHFVVAAAAAAATIPATGTQPHAAAVVEGREPALPACLHSSLSQFTVGPLVICTRPLPWVQYRISTDTRCRLCPEVRDERQNFPKGAKGQNHTRLAQGSSPLDTQKLNRAVPIPSV